MTTAGEGGEGANDPWASTNDGGCQNFRDALRCPESSRVNNDRNKLTGKKNTQVSFLRCSLDDCKGGAIDPWEREKKEQRKFCVLFLL